MMQDKLEDDAKAKALRVKVLEDMLSDLRGSHDALAEQVRTPEAMKHRQCWWRMLVIASAKT
jgi:hypothetical protein